MYPLGHITVVCGATWVGGQLWERVRRGRTPATDTPAHDGPAAQGDQGDSGRAADAIDYRFVALGAVLPDLIDKSIVWVLVPDPEAGGHHVGHSLFLVAAILLAGILLLVGLHENRLALVGTAALLHVLTDTVTHVPHTLLWPFVTLDVPWNGILLRSTNIGGEVAAVIVLFFVLRGLQRRDRLGPLLREGRL